MKLSWARKIDSVSFISDSKPESKQNTKLDSYPEFQGIESESMDKIESGSLENTEDFPITDFGDPGKTEGKNGKDSEIISHTKDIKLQKNSDEIGKKEENEKDYANIKEKQKTLVDFGTASGESSDSLLKIIIDHRETKSGVAKTLDRLGMELRFMALEIGDYIVSDRLAVERKRTDDFACSLIDGKRNLFAQLSDLARVYEKPVLIIEGEDLFTSRQINPNAIYGSLASIAIDFGVSILYSRDEEETASILKILAKREQTENKREINPHGKKSASTLAEQQEYLISSISNIGPKAARNLLSYFGSVEAVMRADIEELKKVKQIGPKTAARIREVLESPYKG